MPCVYILQSGNNDLFKVGQTSGDLHTRIKQLSTGNPCLTPFDAIHTEYHLLGETYLKRSLRAHRVVRTQAKEFYAIAAREMRTRIEDTKAFLAEFVPRHEEAERLGQELSEQTMREPEDEELAIYRHLVEARVVADAAKLDVVRYQDSLKIAIGTKAGLQGLVSWSTQVSTNFDTTGFKIAQPDLYEAWLRTRTSRPFRLS
jgi:hypothetical protein